MLSARLQARVTPHNKGRERTCIVHAKANTEQPNISTSGSSQVSVLPRWRAHAAAVVLSAVVASPAFSVGLESMDILPSSINTPEALAAMSRRSKANLDEVEEKFQQSDTLKKLLAQSEANKVKNKTEIQNKYCYRQAELGVGDCGGLRLIPGMTENGKQKTPEWLAKLLGVEMPPEPAGGTMTLKELFKGKPGFE